MTKYAVSALIAVIALLGGFYGGFRIGQNNASASSSGSGGNTPNGGSGAQGARNPCSTSTGGRNGNNANRAAVFGQITNVAGNVITVHNPTCNTDTKVTLSGTPVIRKTVDGQTSDLTNSTPVTITGTKNSDGTVTANNVSILPAGTDFGQGAGGGNGGGGGFFGGGGGGG